MLKPILVGAIVGGLVGGIIAGLTYNYILVDDLEEIEAMDEVRKIADDAIAQMKEPVGLDRAEWIQEYKNAVNNYDNTPLITDYTKIYPKPYGSKPATPAEALEQSMKDSEEVREEEPKKDPRGIFAEEVSEFPTFNRVSIRYFVDDDRYYNSKGVPVSRPETLFGAITFVDGVAYAVNSAKGVIYEITEHEGSYYTKSSQKGS